MIFETKERVKERNDPQEEWTQEWRNAINWVHCMKQKKGGTMLGQLSNKWCFLCDWIGELKSYQLTLVRKTEVCWVNFCIFLLYLFVYIYILL